MVKKRGNNKGIFIYWTEEEAEETRELFEASGVSKQQQSEFFMKFILDGLKQHNKSMNPNTQTNQHNINDKQIRINKLNEIKGFIKSKPMILDRCFNMFFKTFKTEFGDFRTCFTWFKKLFEEDEFIILYLDKMYILEKHSFFHAQLKEHCFKFPHSIFSYNPQSYIAAKEKVFSYLRVNFHRNNNFDEIEAIMQNNFYLMLQNDEQLQPEQPVHVEIIELRAKWKHAEALDLLNQEREFKASQSVVEEERSAEQFLENLK